MTMLATALSTGIQQIWAEVSLALHQGPRPVTGACQKSGTLTQFQKTLEFRFRNQTAELPFLGFSTSNERGYEGFAKTFCGELRAAEFFNGLAKCFG